LVRLLLLRSLPSTSLVPFADMLNHANDATTHYLVHRVLENNGKLKDC